MVKVAIMVDLNDVVVVTENHGGYQGGKCVACGAIGWLDTRCGYPYPATGVLRNKLIHTKGCSINKYLTPEGNFIPSGKKEKQR